MPHPFDLATTLTPDGPGRFLGQTSPDYWNMVGPYGGITAAALLRALLDDPRHIGEPLSLTVNYCAPVAEGPFVVTVEIVRTGKSTQHASLRLLQDDPRNPGTPITTAIALAVTGVRRPLWSHLAEPCPTAPAPESLQRRPGVAGIRWLDRYDARYPKAPTGPYSPGEAVIDWVRDDPPRPVDYPSLAGLADHFFPTIYGERGAIVPIATVTLNIYFHAGAEALARVADHYLLGTTRAQVYEAGFHDAESALWHEGQLLLTTQQLVWYRD